MKSKEKETFWVGDFELEKRECAGGCGMTFKVLVKSKQRWAHKPERCAGPKGKLMAPLRFTVKP